ncbi:MULTISPECIES: hypothetical protein [Mycolicibacterium]|uniref:Uncharacterized protein n=1 Tax=Mycolicibacterium fortuitum TaxID=1766 RepID=A0AAE5AFU8_MYCFO|nr:MULTISPECIES: hypothetical protein [Mycolicibacterium]MDV7194299.1 hypothetical protein [Mycolicibacterium fortuitum]MDV7294282.1 hypothetical protein [Mycolicibacterium fortuitum]MDV7301395.1 hypothetical protein [Mycolicibacterium fortuitum]MDV7323197.1 hypothetical protein [Mycolicibacterium fortuitum]MDV7363553.1 hypothetical protein [Mycolicibacterium fortuitum]
MAVVAEGLQVVEIVLAAFGSVVDVVGVQIAWALAADVSAALACPLVALEAALLQPVWD